MVECRYCGREFDDESTHREHLRETHTEELGPIDRRRLESEENGRSRTPLVLAGIVLALALGVMVGAGYVLWGSGGGESGGNAPDQASLPESGDATLLQDVEQFPSEGTEHVAEGTNVNYDTMPPTSGPHYSTPAEAGFYEESQSPRLERLVHSLEHGAVVVYYDPEALTPAARENLRGFANRYTGEWSSVIVVPHPAEDPDTPYVLTAWRHDLTMNEYDEATVRAFLAEFLGRGPENPVR